MSKRAEEKALEIFPVKKVPYYGLACNAYFERDANLDNRTLFCMGYEQAAKDTIERALDYLYENLHMRQDEKEEWLDEFKRAMEEE